MRETIPDQPGNGGNGNSRNRRAGMVGLFTVRIKPLLCTGCDECLAVCRYGVLRRSLDGKVEAKVGQCCIGCLKCVGVCRTKAIHIMPGLGFRRGR